MNTATLKTCIVTSWRRTFKVTTKTSPLNIIYSLFKYPLKKKDFDYAQPRMIQSLLNVSWEVKAAYTHCQQVCFFCKNIYTCSLCIKYIPPEESRSPQKPLGFLNKLMSPPVTWYCSRLFWQYCKSMATIGPSISN